MPETNTATYQVQVRSLCPDWVGRKKSDNPQADINSHRDLCKQNNCGYSNRDFFIYYYVDVAELTGLGKTAPVAAEAPKGKRAKAATAIPAATPDLEDLLGEGTSDEDLLGGTSAPADLDEDLL